MNKEHLKQRLQQAKIRQLEGNKPLPTLPQMTKNLGQSVVRNIVSVAQGNALNVSNEEQEHRLNICNSCEFFLKDKKRCQKCGCKLAFKTYLKAEKCPINKW